METIRTLALLSIFTLTFSCHKANLCGLEQDVTLGDIEEVLDLSCFVGGANEQIIRSPEELEALFANRPCEGAAPSIDFSQYSLLGQFGGATGCERFYSRKVSINENQRKYTFLVRVSECGGCEPFDMRWHWVLVPILPEDYSVTFEFETI
ncbi:MAG: hypothetical protein KTR30_19130 [Saprospiraceae bacterium]|nr:hypothetical protein [Saprospiraceae bacterium]